VLHASATQLQCYHVLLYAMLGVLHCVGVADSSAPPLCKTESTSSTDPAVDAQQVSAMYDDQFIHSSCSFRTAGMQLRSGTLSALNTALSYGIT
jgi:hypothetical protein